MPTERFYRLPVEKQIAIRKAAVKEFARVSIDKVSINKVIQDADISRGSFYTYFEDKWDMLGYIFEEGHKQMRGICMEAMEKNGGDIWLMLEDFLAGMLDFCAEKEQFQFLKNVMEHSGPEQMFGGFSPYFRKCGKAESEIGRWCYEHTDKREFRDPSFDTFHRLLRLTMPAMAMAVKAFSNGVPAEKVKEEFSRKLKLLRYGVCFSQDTRPAEELLERRMA